MANKLLGVNISGAEWGKPLYLSTKNGYKGLSYFASKGLTLIRLPVKWEFLQPTAYGAFSQAHVKQLRYILDDAAALGQKVILDVHNYARYNNTPLRSADFDMFANFWKHMVLAFGSHPAVWAYELMNEPHDLTSNSYTWFNLCQAAITMIRHLDDKRYILVPGYQWQGADNWKQHSNILASLADPCNKLIFSAHQYFDDNGSGGTYNTSPCRDVYAGVKRIQPFLDWLTAKNKLGIFTEFGVNTSPAWVQALDAFLSRLMTHPHILGGTYWAAGSGWRDYELSVEPDDGRDKPQMEVLAHYAN